MKKLLLLCFVCLFSFSNFVAAQNNLPEMKLTKSELEAHMKFLASDELAGRRTGEVGNNVAARYIATYFEAYGLKKAPGLDSYYQSFMLEMASPPSSGSLKMNDVDYTFGTDFLILSGDANEVNTTAVFAGHGWVDENTDDYKGLDVKGKVVFVLPGKPGDEDRRAIIDAGAQKRKLAAERGAVAVFELYRMQFPWDFFRRNYSRERLQVAESSTGKDETGITYGFFKEPSPNPIIELQNGKSFKIELKSTAATSKKIPTQNVIGIVEGSDPNLKEEFVLLTAHYDHVGVGKQGGGATTEQDSIFNGSRDNAFGTVGLLAAAKALAQQPSARSVIFLAVTGEEVGLIGSNYYAENPLIPLKKVIFNLNIDTGGYNDTGVVSIIGHGRTGTDALIEAGLKPFALAVKANPAPEQGLFDRSDNVSFARKGIPCITYSPGFDEFDEEIRKYYHQVTDNPDTIDYNYLHKFCQGYAHTTRQVANSKEKPQWIKGDKYEEAGKNLYNK
ncbi:MAG: M20/M25/M40 family metallo-hydrolase [Saprospiraceae bacterium]|nr:M20/M25/M40 family metallo-hydrolase [Saprospiraceae bacterium]